MTDVPTFFGLPVGANPNRDQRVGEDELGRPVYRAASGHQYALGQTYAPPRQTEAGSLARVRETIGNLIRGGVESFVSGVTAPRRALQGQPVTYGDALETAGWAQLGGAAMPAPQGALRSAALRSADDVAETPAQTVARMLREGRALEVTDDLMAQVDPQEMYRLYEAGDTGMPMPMDEASRMARAREMGFDTDARLLHGTTRDFPAFDPRIPPRQVQDPGLIGRAIYTTDSPATADLYASMNWRNENLGAQHYPVVTRAQNPFVSHDGVLPEGRGFQDYHPNGLSVEGGARWQSDLQAAGHDAITFRIGNNYHDQHVIFDPRNIRSRFARFDPRLSHLANLSAGVAAGGVALPYLADDRETQLNALRAYLERAQ